MKTGCYGYEDEGAMDNVAKDESPLTSANKNLFTSSHEYNNGVYLPHCACPPKLPTPRTQYEIVKLVADSGISSEAVCTPKGTS